MSAAAPASSTTSPLQIGPIALAAPTALAPMAGVTDAAFRAQARGFGVGLALSEMVTAAAYLSGKADVAQKARLSADEQAGAAGVQIAGREPTEIAEAARRAEGEGAPLIDLNFGCPAKKVTSGFAGSALMKEPERAARLVDAAIAATSVPITVKMRLGWDDATLTAPEIAARAEASGAAMITLHARTRDQFYQGQAVWRRAQATRERVRIPMLINGDVDGADAARRAMAQSGAEGVMVGRAACGRPWLLAEIAAGLAGGRFTPPSPAERARLAAEYYEAVLSLHGRLVGARAARKHLVWRLEAMDLPSEAFGRWRARLIREEAPERVLGLLAELAARLEDRKAAA